MEEGFESRIAADFQQKFKLSTIPQGGRERFFKLMPIG